MRAWKRQTKLCSFFTSHVAIVKTREKEMSKLFFQYYHYHYGMVKYRRNVNLEEMDSGCSTEKKDFDYSEEYLRSMKRKCKKRKFSFSCRM